MSIEYIDKLHKRMYVYKRKLSTTRHGILSAFSVYTRVRRVCLAPSPLVSAKVYTLRRRIYVVVPTTHIGLYNRCWCKRGTVRNDRSAPERKRRRREWGGLGVGHEASAEYSLARSYGKGAAALGAGGLRCSRKGMTPGTWGQPLSAATPILPFSSRSYKRAHSSALIFECGIRKRKDREKDGLYLTNSAFA